MSEGLRYNQGKTRYDLVPAFAQEQYAKVLTKGAEKYAERNWEKGMDWSKVIASLERHLQAIKRGEDFDPETGLLHSAHVMCNAAFLTEYYKVYPQGDDRPHRYLNPLKIGLDIDEVLADFVGGMMERFPQMDKRAVYWNDPHIVANFSQIRDDANFWSSLRPKIDSIPFEPHCYITSRPICEDVTKQWLQENGFPTAEIYTVGHNQNKVETAKLSGIDIFVDDRYENFVELNNAGICCFLWDAPHNSRYEVGFKRLYSLQTLVEL